MGQQGGARSLTHDVIQTLEVPIRFTADQENFIEILPNASCKIGPRYEENSVAQVIFGVVDDRPFWFWSSTGGVVASRDFEGQLYFNDKISFELKSLFEKVNEIAGFRVRK